MSENKSNALKVFLTLFAVSAAFSFSWAVNNVNNTIEQRTETMQLEKLTEIISFVVESRLEQVPHLRFAVPDTVPFYYPVIGDSIPITYTVVRIDSLPFYYPVAYYDTTTLTRIEIPDYLGTEWRVNPRRPAPTPSKVDN